MTNSEASLTPSDKELEVETLGRSKSTSSQDPATILGEAKILKEEGHLTQQKLDHAIFGIGGFGENEEQARLLNGQAINLAIDFNSQKNSPINMVNVSTLFSFHF